MVFKNSIAARAYGCLSTSFSRLERDTRRREALSLYWDSNAFALSYGTCWVEQRCVKMLRLPYAFDIKGSK